MVSRLERTRFAAWWWTVDRLLLAALLALMLAGIILSLAASPPVASRLGLDPFYFVNRHVLYLIPALAVMLATSFLPPRHIRRLAVIVFIVSLLLIAATLHFGAEVKGARRWIVLLGINIQPSEFLKPAFVILIAWLFGESARRPEMPANTFALALLAVAVAGLVLQPDFGQTMLVALVWSALFFLAGMRWSGWWGSAVPPRSGLPALTCSFPTWRGASSGSAIPPPATPSTSTRRSNRSSAAAGSGVARARAPSSASCPRAIPTSCSRSPPKNSASCCACCWSRYSPLSSCALCATPAVPRTRSRASPQPALPSCSGCNRPSTWR